MPIPKPNDTEPGLELLVASGGGHLQQLHILRERFCPALPSRHWVTYDLPSSSLVTDGGTPCTFGHHPTTRNIPNALRNYGLARGLLRELRPRRVVSTGAAIAVPFLVEAARLGIPATYIESATRTHGPSLSGRMLSWVPGVDLRTQHRRWAGGRWRWEASVFDGFATQERAGRAGQAQDAGLRVAVSLGTHGFSFDELTAALARVLTPSDGVFAQLGATTHAAPGWDVEHYVPHGRLQQQLRRADVVVAHAGTGIALTALLLGKLPVLVPRRSGEHVDDHQTELAAELAGRGLCVPASPRELTRDHLIRAASATVVRRPEHHPIHLPTQDAVGSEEMAAR